MEGPDAWAREVPYQAGKVREPKNKITQTRKRERWNGKGGAERRSELTQIDVRLENITQPEKQNNSNSEDGSGEMVSGEMVMVVGREGVERAHSSRYPTRRTNCGKGPNAQVQMVKPTGLLG